MTVVPFAVCTNWARVLIDAGWKLHQVGSHGPSGFAVLLTAPTVPGAGSLIVSQAEGPDDGRGGDEVEWLHASLAFVDRMPTYRELTLVHRAVFGRKRWAYHVYAPEAAHINDHPYALHLWGRADGEPVLPNFGLRGTI